MPVTPIFGKKNVLVTGGAGFIGSHLCERLLKDAHVICMDDFSNSAPSNIDHLLRDPGFILLKHDINQPIDMLNFPELERFKVRFQGVQEIYHLACPTTAKQFDQMKIQTLLSNSVGTRHVLDLAVAWKAKVLFASSAVVYGPRRADQTPFVEDDHGIFNHLSPRGCYDEGKRFAETMCATYTQVYDIETKIARVFRTYGPRLKLYDGQMLSDFIVDALDGNDLVIYGDEQFTTSLTFVTDVVDGLLKFMSAPRGIDLINFGSDQAYKIADVAQKIIDLTHSSSKIRFEASLPFITPLGIPDIRRAKETLGWIPLTTLENGLQKMVEYTVATKGMTRK